MRDVKDVHKGFALYPGRTMIQFLFVPLVSEVIQVLTRLNSHTLEFQNRNLQYLHL